nr:hypothetical protein [Erythrotrichia longistipitata]
MNNNKVLMQIYVTPVERTLIQITKKHFKIFFPNIWNSAMYRFCQGVEEKISTLGTEDSYSEYIDELNLAIKAFKNSDYPQGSNTASDKKTGRRSHKKLLPEPERLNIILGYIEEDPTFTPTKILKWSVKEGINLGSLNTIRRLLKKIDMGKSHVI